MDEANNGERDVVSVRELAEYLGVQPNTIYAALARKELPHLRVGGRILVSRQIVDQILRGERVAR